MDVIIPDDLFPVFRNLRNEERIMRRGRCIGRRRRTMNAFIWWESGRVRVYCSNASGRELTLRIMGKGRLIGEDVFVEFTGAKPLHPLSTRLQVVSCSVEELFPYIVESEALLRAILRHLTGTNIR